jgi:hypothetical protein
MPTGKLPDPPRITPSDQPNPYSTGKPPADVELEDKAPGIGAPDLGQMRDSFDGTWLEPLASGAWIKPIFIFGFACIFLYAIAKTVAQDMARKGQEGTTAGLNYVVGPMGAGKSMFGVRQVIAALRKDQYVITNVRLLPGWADKVLQKHYGKDWKDPARRARARACLEGRYIYESSLRRAMRYRTPCAYCGGDTNVEPPGSDGPTASPATCNHAGPRNESRALMVWDESHNDLNNRDWDASSVANAATRAEERRRKAQLITWGTQLRKLGFSGFLLSQHHENTDAQLRRICNHVIRLQNQRNAEGLWIMNLLPRRLTLFLVYWYPAHLADGKGEMKSLPIRRERYWLPWEKCLYNSWETFHAIDAGEDEETTPIHLPAKIPMPEPAIVPAAAGAPLAGEAAAA